VSQKRHQRNVSKTVNKSSTYMSFNISVFYYAVSMVYQNAISTNLVGIA